MPRLSTLAFVSACFLLSTAAQAEYYGNPSLPPHPYAAQKIQPYATRVAPRIHVNHHGTEQQRNYIYVGSHRITAPASGRFDRRHKPVDHGSKRVIAADAEVTIFGPDRISIRLFRKGQGPRATARSY
jgi:hypothetical protein